jgi:hypothetical protein
MSLGFTQSLIEITNKIFVGSGVRPVRKADNPSAICEPIVYNVGVPSSEHYSLYGPLRG